MSEAELQRVLAVLKVLADESRLRMIGVLAMGERSGVELAHLLDLRAATVSHHLARLGDVGLVTVRKEGATRRYALDAGALSDLRLHHLEPEQVAAMVPEAAPDAYAHKVLTTFFDGPKLLRIPAARKKRDVVLAWLAERFPLDVDLAEAEVNETLQQHHWDSATLRRELIGAGWMTRAAGTYRRVRRPGVASGITTGRRRSRDGS